EMAAEDDVKQGNAVATEFRESITEALSPRQTLPGFADPRIERASGVELPSWFVDRCRRAYLSVAFDAAAECRVLGVTTTACGPPSEPARFFYQLVDREVMLGLRETFANVVMDLPPTLSISYGSLAFGLADRLLIVARSGVTLTDDLERSIKSIGKNRVNGIVLNGTDERTPAWL